jgi:hypothetical protein
MPLPPAARDTPLTNPSAHFGCPSGTVPVQCSKPAASKADPVAELTEGAARLRLRFAGAPPSLFFVDARGYTRWHGESSGLPLLDYLMDKHSVRPAQDAPPAAGSASSGSSDVSSEGSPPGIPLIGPEDAPVADPDYGAPEAMWAMITKIIPAELMDECACRIHMRDHADVPAVSSATSCARLTIFFHSSTCQRSSVFVLYSYCARGR